MTPAERERLVKHLVECLLHAGGFHQRPCVPCRRVLGLDFALSQSLIAEAAERARLTKAAPRT